MSKFSIFLMMFIFCDVAAQDKPVIYEAYPVGQDNYVGKKIGLYQDIKNAATKLQLQPCDRKEIYTATVLVEPTGKIKFVKDVDSVYIRNNKCAYDFSKKLLPYLNRWIPAKVNNQPVPALTTFEVHPFIIHHSKENVSQNLYKEPQFSKGINEFRMLMGDTFMRLIKNNKDARMVMTFVVNEEGTMEDIAFNGSFDEKVLAAAKYETERLNRKKMWKPATFNGIPIRHRFNMPVRQEFSFELERSNLEEQSPHYKQGKSF